VAILTKNWVSGNCKMSSINNHTAILCSRLDLPGGIERAVVNTANLFASNGQQVTLVVLDETNNSFYPIHAAVKVVQHPLSFGITREGNVITRKIKWLRDVLKLGQLLKSLAPQLIIATEYPFAAAAILSGARKHSKVIAWEHHHYYELKRNLFWNKMFRLTYPRLDAVVCLNEDEKKLFQTVNQYTVVIPNFIAPVAVTTENNKRILTVARLTAVKGIDFLLTTAKEVLTKHPDWQWKLIGDGELKKDVLDFIDKENLHGKLLLQPPVDHNVLSEYQQASLYVMTSRNECFPMTLLEAQSAGLPCIAFDCATGPGHIITNDNGILVEKENPMQMADAISSLIQEKEKRKKMSGNAFEDVKRFSPGAVYQLWQQKIFSLL
jgi:glycosyltransferase involved in cell wall biosynthesis